MENNAQMKIGWAVSDITPYGREVSLYGQSDMRVTRTVRDNLCAVALAMEGNGGHILMVSCDLCYIPALVMEGVRRALASLDGFNPDNLMINATHSHTSPYLERHRPSELWGELFDFGSQFVGDMMTPEEYSALVVAGVTDAACRAWAARAPGGVSFELAYPGVNFSRRVTFCDGTCNMYGQTAREDFAGFEEASDQGMELMYTFDNAEKLTGVVANLACPSQVIELCRAVTADYVGEVRDIIKSKYNVPVLVQIAPAGDQSPRDLLRRKWEKSHNYFSRDHLDDAFMKTVAGKVADAIESRIAAARTRIEWSPIFVNACRWVELPLYQVTQNEYEEALPVANALEVVYHANGERFGPGEQLQYVKNRGIVIRYQYQQKSVVIPLEINAVRIGAAAFISNPFELFTVYGLRIKAINPARQTFCVQLANGSEGYLPSSRAVVNGNYGALHFSCWVGPEGGDQLVSKSVEILRDLFKE